jgi:aspartate aminotransferase-like enzyme
VADVSQWRRLRVQVAKRFGTAIQVIDETPDGDVDLEHLERLLADKNSEYEGFTVVSITHVPTSSGRVYDAEGVGAVVAHHPGARRRTAGCACLAT